MAVCRSQAAFYILWTMSRVLKLNVFDFWESHQKLLTLYQRTLNSQLAQIHKRRYWNHTALTPDYVGLDSKSAPSALPNWLPTSILLSQHDFMNLKWRKSIKFREIWYFYEFVNYIISVSNYRSLAVRYLWSSNFILETILSQAWWCLTVISVFGRLKQRIAMSLIPLWDI